MYVKQGKKESVVGLCCRYLGGSPVGWKCLKLDENLKKLLDDRVASNTMNAKGDNCEGKEDLN